MRAIFPLVALGCGLWLLALAIPVAFIQSALIVTGLIAWLVAGWTVARSKFGKRYDLDELKRLHEQAELDALDVDGVHDGNVVVCARCGTAYSDHIPVCPGCRCNC